MNLFKDRFRKKHPGEGQGEHMAEQTIEQPEVFQEHPMPHLESLNQPNMSANEIDDEQPAVTSLPVELQYLDRLVRYRLANEFQSASEPGEPKMPRYEQWELPIGRWIIGYNITNQPLTADEARLLLIGLVHHVQPNFFDHSIDSMLKGAGDFPKIGGARGKN